MSRPPLRNVALAVAVRFVLGRIERPSRHAPPADRRQPARDSRPLSRRPLAAAMLVSLVVAVGAMVPFEHPATRAVGVAAIFAFIVSGVFLIADPRWLDGDE
jgi:hypothetical protein